MCAHTSVHVRVHMSVCVCVCAHTYTDMCYGTCVGEQNNFLVSSLIFHHMGTGDWTQVIRVGDKLLY